MAKKPKTKTKNVRRKRQKAVVISTSQVEIDSRGQILGAFAQVLSDVTQAAVQISQHVSSAPEYRNISVQS